MGYYSEIEFQTRIKLDKITECCKFIERRICELSKGYVNWHLRNITEISRDGYVKFNETYCKWYHEAEFIMELLPFLEDGIITFKGEDGEFWGYQVSGGRLFMLGIKYERMNEIPTVTA